MIMVSVMQFLVAIMLVAVLVILFFVSYLLNRNTKKPIEMKITDQGCKACKNYSCSHKEEVEEKQ